MKCSICIATYNKAIYLDRTLRSIFIQEPGFDFEVIIVDDGSSDHTKEVCESFPVRYIKLEGHKEFRGPSIPRNVAYRAARGEVLICQSDEVIHQGENVIADLCNRLHKGKFIIATVYNYDWMTHTRLELYSGIENQRPLFFLGSLYRRDLYAVGGNDEEFGPAYEDNWFGSCLLLGLGLKADYAEDILGYHQRHERLNNLAELCQESSKIHGIKYALAVKGEGKFEAAGGPWPYDS